MSTPFVGEIRMFGFSRLPVGWFPCDGRLVPVAGQEALFTLIGTTYGGDGQNTFGLPDLRGRLPVHQGQGLGLTQRVIGQSGGTESVTLTLPQLPAHNHPLNLTSAAATADVPSATAVPGSASGAPYYVTDTNGATAMVLDSAAVSATGSSLPHENCMPTLTVQYCIAWSGIFPSRG